jgi:hypothetical protein
VANPASLAMWMMTGKGSTKPPRSLKAEKKPEVVQQQGDACCVM